MKVASDATNFEIKSYSASPAASLFELPPGAVITTPPTTTTPGYSTSTPTARRRVRSRPANKEEGPFHLAQLPGLLLYWAVLGRVVLGWAAGLRNREGLWRTMERIRAEVESTAF